MSPSPLDVPKRRLEKPAGWHLCPHAQQRAAELGYSTEEVLECVHSPSLSYECDAKKYRVGERIYKRGDIAVVGNPETLTVVTVILPSKDLWQHGKDTRRTFRR